MKPTPPFRRLVAALLGATLSLFTGCDGTKTYTVQVDAISDPPETGQPAQAAQSYHIRTHNPKLDESSLRYKEVADYVRTALSGKGMYEAPTADKADVVIDIDYGMDAPRVKFEVYNILNDQQLVFFDTTVTANNGAADPKDALGLPTTYTRGANFGKARTAADYQVPREYRVSASVTF